VDRITYDELARDLRLHYETTGTRGLKEADTRFRALLPFFTGRRVASIAGGLAEAYVQHRLQAGVANATINRELATLIRMLRLGYERDKVGKLPVIHKLAEAAPRSEFSNGPTSMPCAASFDLISNAPARSRIHTDGACNRRCCP
jgi:hypothetical protein